MKIEFKKLYDDVVVPEYATEGSAGFDLVIHNFKKYIISKTDKEPNIYPSSRDISLYPGDRLLIGCGFSVAISEGFEMQIRSRSGKALKEGLVVLNSPGTIDSDYRGEVGIILINHSNIHRIITKGDRVAQAIISPYIRVNFNIVEELSETTRGEGGFGHTDSTPSRNIPKDDLKYFGKNLKGHAI